MYPLKVFRPVDSGFAVANTEAEHQALSDAGYMPAFVVQDAPVEALPAEVVTRKPGRPKKVSDAGA